MPIKQGLKVCFIFDTKVGSGVHVPSFQSYCVCMNDLWVNIKKVAEAKGQNDTRALRLYIKRHPDFYDVRTVKVLGGESFEIRFSTLEPYLQEKLKKDFTFQAPMIVETRKSFVPDIAKTIALSKIDILNAWLNYRKKYKPKKVGDNLFLEMYNSGELLKNAYRVVGQTSIGSLKRWNVVYQKYRSWEKLVPQYRYSSIANRKTKLTQEMIELFTRALTHENCISVGAAINFTIEILKNNGIEDIPSAPTFRRFANNYRDCNNDVYTYARGGRKALNDKLIPDIKRDASQLEVGQIWVADGHTLNIEILNPFTGKPTRLTLVGFFDWKANTMVGYEIMLSENISSIASALRNSILRTNMIPQIIYQDNGRAFKSSYFQDIDFNDSGLAGVYQNLGIESVFAKVLNAQAKVIERFFKTFQEWFEKTMWTYTGTSIENKPARLLRGEKFHKDFHKKMYKDNYPTIEEVKARIDCWLEFFNSKPCPNAPGMTRQEVLNNRVQQDIDINRLDELMMATEIRTIRKNGVTLLKSEYFHDTLYPFNNIKVQVRYSLFDLSKVNIYSMKGEFICIAEKVTASHPMEKYFGSAKTLEQLKYKLKKKKQLMDSTIKKVKKILPSEDLEYLKEAVTDKFLENESPQYDNVIELKPLQIKELPTYTGKKIYLNSFEKYEDLINNGCKDNDERKWLAEYIKSNEFKEIYQ